MDTIRTSRTTIPALGFGTWQLEGQVAYDGVRTALDVGYRHIDTAQIYRNEEEVGRAIADSDLDRDAVFVTTKIWRDAATPKDVERTAQESLERLGLDHVDLLLIHWPADEIAPLEATVEALDRLRERELTRAIGVSNYPAARFARALEVAPVATNQVEHHPYLAVDAISEVAAANDAFVTAYSPIAQGKVLDDATIAGIAEAHGVSPVQVTVRWHLQRGVSAIPRSSKPERIAANGDVFGFELSDDEVAAITELGRGERLIDPPFMSDWDAA
ncbi:MAG: aldo/keto reductase [Nitriliruptoraceae bacterium]|nr:aldo/keto reductase [Nitriliruptoraceae bacterium]